MQEKILAALKQEGKPMPADSLAAATGGGKPAFEEAIQKLQDSGSIVLSRKHKIALPEQLGLLKGKLQGNVKGFAFFVPESGEKDVYIPPEGLHGAIHGDTVLVQCSERGGRLGDAREGEVVKVLEHANSRIVGVFEKSGRIVGYVIPDDARIPIDILIPREYANGAKPGQKVVTEIVSWEQRRAPEGKVVEILGNAGEADTDILAIIRQYGLNENFPKAAQAAARAAKQTVDPDEALRREDLRNHMLVTIDGADAKDFDDAVSLTTLAEGNWLLGVHIADVAHYVREGAALDKEALKRGTSVYLPGRSIPMLPRELSNGICSLNPGEDRLALSCFMEINERGDVVNHRLAETVIRSKARMVYEDVSALLDGDSELREKHAAFVPMLEQMLRLCTVLSERRKKRGGLDFEMDEALIEVDAEGMPVVVGKRERGISNRMIEEFMLVCNETVAQHMFYLEKPWIYRVHEKPDKEKISELSAFIKPFGLSLRAGKDMHPKTLQKLLHAVKGRKEETMIERVLLRSLKKARYCEENLGHFGLAADIYCHFTSPIRRYPDLMVHRILKEMVRGELNEKRTRKLRETLPEIASAASELERKAMEVERAVEDFEKCQYMSGRVGKRYRGMISGVTGFGFFVELENTVEGLVRVTSLDDDFYEFDEKNYRLTGRNLGRTFRIGDNVKIEVLGVDLKARKIEFGLVKKSKGEMFK